MKKTKRAANLSLTTETIRQLDTQTLRQAAGGLRITIIVDAMKDSRLTCWSAHDTVC